MVATAATATSRTRRRTKRSSPTSAKRCCRSEACAKPAAPVPDVQGQDGDSTSAASSESQQWQTKVAAHHRRQISVAAILDRTFGRLARCHPDLWERRAYLMLVGLVYERLATNEDELSTEELVTLAKVLAEQRRAQARTSTPSGGDGDTDEKLPSQGPLPERFAEAIREVYGTHLSVAQPEVTNHTPTAVEPVREVSQEHGVGG